MTIRGNTVEVRIREGVDPQLALTKLRELSQPLGGILSATGQRSVDVVDAGNGVIRLTPTEPAIIERIRQSVEQSIQIVERRVNELGTVEPLDPAPGRRPHPGAGAGPAGSVAAEGTARQDRQADFRWSIRSMPVEQALQGSVPPDSTICSRAPRPRATSPI